MMQYIVGDFTLSFSLSQDSAYPKTVCQMITISSTQKI